MQPLVIAAAVRAVALTNGTVDLDMERNPENSGDGHGCASSQAYLGGIDVQFQVVEGQGPGQPMVGVLGPAPTFGVGTEVIASTVLQVPAFELPVIENFPQLAEVDPGSAIYLGRVAGTGIDTFIFPLALPTDGGDTETIGLYASQGPLAIDLSYTAEEILPGYSRTSAFLEGAGEADIFWWGPLDAEASVVTLAVDEDLHAAARPRARYVVFDMSGTPRWAALTLLALNSNGEVLSGLDLQSNPPPAD